MPINFNNVFYTYQLGSPFASSALKSINLEIKDHEFVSLIGHTGSGKSTLGQLINALLRPTEGTVRVGSFTIDSKQKKTKGLKQLKKYAGLVFQFPEYQLFEETVIKDVSFGPKNFGLKEEEAKVKAMNALRLVGIDDSLFERSPFELSGGQKRRVAIAGIIALDPDILILDEPTAGLDPRGEKEMMELFKKIHDNGTTIIMITHNMDNVLEYCNRAIVLSKGEIISDSTPLELFAKDNLTRDYNLHEPKLLSFAKDLKRAGLNINLSNVKNIDTLVSEIKGAYHG